MRSSRTSVMREAKWKSCVNSICWPHLSVIEKFKRLLPSIEILFITHSSFEQYYKFFQFSYTKIADMKIIDTPSSTDFRNMARILYRRNRSYYVQLFSQPNRYSIIFWWLLIDSMFHYSDWNQLKLITKIKFPIIMIRSSYSFLRSSLRQSTRQ